MSKILLARHGDAEPSSTERLWGQTDVPLSATGLRQAEQLRQRLAHAKIDGIYSSDLRRALLTAETIASDHGLGVITCAELREIDFGQLEGVLLKQIGELYPELVRQWLTGNPELKYPGGESLGDFTERVKHFLGRLENHTDQENILIVAHSGPLRLLVCRLLGMEFKHWWQLRLGLASLSVIERYPQGTLLSLFNDVCHLKGGG